MRLVFVSSLLLSIILVACGGPVATEGQTTDWGNAILEGRRQAAELRSMNDSEERDLGIRIDGEMKDQSTFAKTGIFIRPSQNPVLRELVNRVGQRLAAHSERKYLQYTFEAVEDWQVNAFATVGGFVYVNTGLIGAAENEAQLAGVLAHEIVHIEKKHALFQMARQFEREGVKKGLGVVGNMIAGMGYIVNGLSRSRADEFQADELGFLLLRKAGYAADEMIEFYSEALGRSGAGDNVPWILKTHPSIKDRIAALARLRRPSDAAGDGTQNSEYAIEVHR